MQKIKYEDYVTDVDKRLQKYYISCYTGKYAFRNTNLSKLKVNLQLLALFRRYMQDDIFIKWDIKNEKD